MHRSAVLVCALLIAVLALALLTAAGATPILDGRLVDSDAYMRLERARDLWRDGQWSDLRMTSTNAPYGEEIAWSRAFDALLIAGAAPLAPFLGFEPALFAWGIAVSPVLLLATLLAASWAFRPILGDGGFLLAVAMALAQPQFAWMYLPGRPDHHSLMGLLFVSCLGVVLRLALGAGGVRLAVLGGALGSLALWVSTESMIAQAVFPLALIVLWIWRREDFLDKVAAWLLGLAGGLTLVLVVEKGGGWFDGQIYARTSGVHWLLAAAGAVLWQGVLRLDRARALAAARSARMGLAGAAAVLLALLMAAAFPRFFGGPLVDMDPALLPWLHDNPEFETILPTGLRSAGKFVFHLLPGLVAAFYAAWRLASRKDGRDERALAVILVGLAFYLPLALHQMRWSSYVQVLAVLPGALLLLAVLRRAVGLRLLPLRAGGVAATLFLGLSAHMLGAAVFVAAAEPGPAEPPRAAACDDFRSLGLALARQRAPGDDILFSYLYRGPELLYWSGYAVVGAPYVAPDSLTDTEAVWRATDDDRARAVLRRRGVDVVVTCACCSDAAPLDAAPDSLHGRLRRGEAPAWLRRIALPEALSPWFQAYRLEERP